MPIFTGCAYFHDTGWRRRRRRQISSIASLRSEYVQMSSLRKRPHLPPNQLFYVPNPCILGTRPVLPCKNGSCCMLYAWVGGNKERVYLTVQCLPLVVRRCNCRTSKFDSICAYRSGEIRVLRISHCCIVSVPLGLPTQFLHCCLVKARAFMAASLIVILWDDIELFRPTSGWRRRRRRRREVSIG